MLETLYQSLSNFLPFFASTGVVALAEMGDKTQLLAFILAARFKKPWPIILGIFVATLLNHALAGALGAWITSLVNPDVMRWILGLLFIAMAIWMMIPDKVDEDDVHIANRFGIFGATVIAFFIAEMGDKTQIATIAMAANYTSTYLIVAGTTLGMMIANVPAVILGNIFSGKIPLKLVHSIAAFIFVIMGLLTLLKVDTFFN